MTQTEERPVNEFAAQLVLELMNVTWYWVMGEFEIVPTDHECTADCQHWKEVR